MKRLAHFIAVFFVCLLTTAAAFASEAKVPTKPFFQAISTADIDEIKLHLSRKDLDVNKEDASQNTPLGVAVEGGRLEVVQLLVEAGANVATPSRAGLPLTMAVIRGNTEIVKFLVEKGANVNAADPQGVIPLVAAAENGYLDIVEFLVGKGADVNAKDRRGQTPLSIAMAGRHTEVMAYLREHGAEEPVNPFDMRVYGDRGLRGPGSEGPPGEPGMDTGPDSSAANVQILGDPNEIRARVAGFAGLPEALAAVDANSASEQRSWRQRRTDNRAMLIRTVEKQFEEEMAFVKRIAQSEKAVKTTAAIDDLAARRKARYKVIYEDLRDEKRAELLEEREAGARMRASGRSRGRAAMTDPMAGPYANDPYASPTTARPAPRVRASADANEPALDATTENQLQAWRSVDPLDKRELLNSVHALDLREYEVLRQTAAEEAAKKTAAAIEGLMLARQQRVTSITAKMVEEDERLQRLEGRAGGMMTPGATMAPGTTRGRGGRAATGQEETTTQRRGRRYR
ncbi:MAG TPA: ankyrin repeat domain-containing protein [Sedimentisphaerales bacterium]|nr:ankyrin repeat domain-containing protein [Sedimentisphaerales bacterium]HRS11275.1 ankyrin repeat domain-containing protein [Sedimentisphaerales bacterium]HRV47853.1 ankyrin repeat domain-containing protein [Sedimentisphaerales bacterium]